MSAGSNTFHMNQPVLALTAADFAPLLPAAEASPLRRSRICLHADHDDPTHEMVVCLLRDCCIRPHRHAGKSESYHVLSGRLRIVLFDEAGAVDSVIPLESPAQSAAYYCRLSQPVWHTVLVDSDYVLFHETTTGPYLPGQTEFAPWAAMDSPEEARKYTLQLRASLE